MNAVERRFDQLADQGKKALIPYLMSGFPSRRKFRELLRLVLDEGADVVEVGLPFSDPLADGPVIQAAGQASLARGTTLASTLEDVAGLASHRPELPRLLMSYFNPLRARGLDRSARDCRRHGIEGWIVPDRDLDHPREVLSATAKQDLACVPLIAPTTPPERLPAALSGAGGFVYLVSVTGVTGARRGAKFQLSRHVRRIRNETSLPVCIGFGVSGREQARDLGRWADGVIVGSALLEPFLRQSAARATTEMKKRLRDIARGLRER